MSKGTFDSYKEHSVSSALFLFTLLIFQTAGKAYESTPSSKIHYYISREQSSKRKTVRSLISKGITKQ